MRRCSAKPLRVFFSVKEGEAAPKISARLGSVVKAAGFSGDGSEGNFQKLVTLSDPEKDFDEVARTLLSVLYTGYGVKAREELFYEAPLVSPTRRARL